MQDDQPDQPGDKTRPLRSRSARFDDAVRWSRQQLAWISSNHSESTTDELLVFRQAAKLVEEVGELHAELLGRSGLQRQSKGTFTDEALAEECADVAITLMVLSEALNVDLLAAIAAKMDKVDERRQLVVGHYSTHAN